jgi:NAD(P)-dependent dehydrogenase (short-subunit alcohol dehydrogenase family)
MRAQDPAPVTLTGFRDATFVVTGAASGIGRAVTMLIAAAGGRVVGGDRSDTGLADLRADADAQQLPVTAVHLEVTDAASVQTLLDIAAGYGNLRGLVCSAGISPNAAFLDMSPDLWQHVLAVNLTGTFLVAQGAARIMAEADGGAIVTVSSAAHHRGTPGLAHYGASKAGIESLTRTIARELGPRNIRANCVAPGAVDTPLLWSVTTREQAATPEILGPLGRIGQPRDLADCIAFLLSEQSSWITGQTVHVSGGTLLF